VGFLFLRVRHLNQVFFSGQEQVSSGDLPPGMGRFKSFGQFDFP